MTKKFDFIEEAKEREELLETLWKKKKAKYSKFNRVEPTAKWNFEKTKG